MTPDTSNIHANNEKLSQFLLSTAMQLRSQKNTTPPPSSTSSFHSPSVVISNRPDSANMASPHPNQAPRDPQETSTEVPLQILQQAPLYPSPPTPPQVQQTPPAQAVQQASPEVGPYASPYAQQQHKANFPQCQPPIQPLSQSVHGALPRAGYWQPTSSNAYQASNCAQPPAENGLATAQYSSQGRGWQPATPAVFQTMLHSQPRAPTPQDPFQTEHQGGSIQGYAQSSYNMQSPAPMAYPDLAQRRLESSAEISTRIVATPPVAKPYVPPPRLENPVHIAIFLQNLPPAPLIPITLARYSPEIFNSIKSVPDAHALLDAQIDKSLIRSLFSPLFIKHGVTLNFGVDLVHKHWDLDRNARLMHIDGVYWIWKFAEHSRVGGTIYPIAWLTNGGNVYPYEFAFIQNGMKAPPSVAHYPEFAKEYFRLVEGLGLEGVLGLRLVPHQVDYPNNDTCVHWLHDKPFVVPECASFDKVALQQVKAMMNKKGLPGFDEETKTDEGEGLPFIRYLDEFLEDQFPGQTLAANMVDVFWFFHEPHGHRMYRCWCWNGLG